MKKHQLNILIALGLIGLVVISRILPHMANFAPVTAMAIFSGALLPRWLAVWVPLSAIVLSDLVIGFYNTILVTWACYAIIAIASSYALKKPSLRRGVGLTVASSLFFFLVTNFATWVWSGMYAHTVTGLGQCFAMALPFFRGTALGDLAYTGALFGIYALVTRLVAMRTPAKIQSS